MLTSADLPVCWFCDSSAVKQESYIIEGAVPDGLTRAPTGLFEGFSCKNCGSIMNSRGFDTSKYSSGVYSTVDSYQRPEPGYDYTGSLITEFLAKQDTALEIGCGQGSVSMFLKELGVKVEVVEPDEGFKKQLSQEFHVFSDVCEVARKYRVCFSIGVLEHIEDPLQHIKQITSECLMPGGIYLCQFPNVRSWSRIISPSTWDMLFEPGHLSIPSVEGLIIASKKKNSGFEVVRSFSSSILSRGRIPYFPRRYRGVERVMKGFLDKSVILRWLYRKAWESLDCFGMGETVVVAFRRPN